MLNLCFHGIGTPRRELEPGEDAYWVEPAFFHDVLDLVRGRDDVRLSFDDGNASDAEIGLPGLAERGLTADFYVLAGRLDRPGSLSRDQVHELAVSQMRVGSHGMHHRSWRHMSPEDTEQELVVAPRMIAEAAGAAVAAAACPLGEYDRTALRSLRRSGFTRVMTSDRAVAGGRAWLQPRYSLRTGDTVASVQALLDTPPGLAERAVSRARVLAKSMR